VPGERIELPTNGLQNRCSTAELTRLQTGLFAHRAGNCHSIAIAKSAVSPLIRGEPAAFCPRHKLG
jgi:hypothetical protein